VTVQIQIAGVTLAIESKDRRWSFDADNTYRPFEVSAQEADVDLAVHWQPPDVARLGKLLFSARDMPEPFPPNWRLYRNGAGLYELEVNASAHRGIRQRLGLFRPDFRQGEVFVDVIDENLSLYPYPLATPLDRVLFVNIMAHGLGVMLHACGVVLDGKGYVFAGPSDAGKTTLSRLWGESSEVTILGDECLILRRHQGQFWVYGTPWVGEAGLYSPRGVPVGGLFFLHHAGQNGLTPTPLGRAAEQLLAQSLLTPYDASAVEFGLDFCLSFVSEVPAHDLGFVPDQSAVQFLRGHLGRRD
jgi:hypothetical protein